MATSEISTYGGKTVEELISAGFQPTIAQERVWGGDNINQINTQVFFTHPDRGITESFVDLTEGLLVLQHTDTDDGPVTHQLNGFAVDRQQSLNIVNIAEKLTGETPSVVIIDLESY